MVVTEEHISTIVRIAREYNAKRLILFGSALETPNDAHDIDLAADMPGWSALTFANTVESVLQCPVDIVMLGDDTDEHPFIRSILRKGKSLL